jgi:SAM-dependent methyltransferase
MRSILLILIKLLALLWIIIPAKLRIILFTSLFLLESRSGKSSLALKKLFKIKDKLTWVINERALSYGFGIHPKHKLTNYHQFFIDNIIQGENVLDIGCGYGAVSRSIAAAYPESNIVGVDINPQNISMAKSADNPKNLKFIISDALKVDLKNKFDVVVLSNVLEHINDRVIFLKNLKSLSSSKKFLIRVPLFERDWEIAMRQELKINYFNDTDHKIEHTLNEFENEINSAGMKIKKIQTLWGEIWAVCYYE